MRTLKLVRCSIVPRTLIGGAQIHTGLNPAWGLFRGSENRDARSRRALSRLVLTRGQDCRQAGTLQATLAEGYPDRRFAC